MKKDIIGRNGINYTEALGLSSPVTFDELIRRSYDSDYFGVWHISDANGDSLNREGLMNAYKSGKQLIEVNLYLPKTDEYNRIYYYLLKNENTGAPHVFACCIDITANEKSRDRIYGELRTDKSEIDEIVASAQIGIWHIYLLDGEKPRLRATPKMLEIMGLAETDMTDEELYDYWLAHVKKSSLPYVNVCFNEIIAKGFAETTYTWIHPAKGETFVRVGGTLLQVPGRGNILRGYHSDVTETITTEARQKQLLADALEEVKKQKELLQAALDDYKEADYDRRRDFLTGLRNRQDMFEMLQDVLSGKRDRINAMFMMDIDNFKLLNDHYGHSYGDKCLQTIGKALNEYAKGNEMFFFRYGGEEILGISFNQKKSPHEIAEELLCLVRTMSFEREDMPDGIVTVSLGYTIDNRRYEKMVDHADTAMYAAKNQGKNRAVCYEILRDKL